MYLRYLNLRHQLTADDGQHFVQLLAIFETETLCKAIHDLHHVGGTNVVVIDVLLRNFQMVLSSIRL